MSPPESFGRKLGDLLASKTKVPKHLGADPAPSDDPRLNQLIADVRSSRAQGVPELTHTAIGNAHDNMFDILISRASELTAGLNRVSPEASSPGIDAIMEHVANIAKSIDQAAHALDVSKHAALDYNASVTTYWANMTPARDAAKQLQAESDKANQLIALGVVSIGDDGEQLIPDLRSLTPLAVPTAFSIMDGERVRIPEKVQQDLQSNAELQRQIASTFRNAQPSIQTALSDSSMINPPPPIPLSPEPAGSTGNAGSGNGAAGVIPAVSSGGRSSNSGSQSSTRSNPTLAPVGARATAGAPRLDNATLLGAQSQTPMPSVMMQPGSFAGQSLPAYSSPPTGGLTAGAPAGPRAMTDSEFSKLLESARGRQGPTGQQTAANASPNISTSGTSTSAATPGSAPLVQPPSWANAQTAGTTESAGGNGKPGSSAATTTGASGSRSASGMPMMPMMPPGQGPAGGKADKSDRPAIISVDPMVYGDDIKSTDPVIRPRRAD
ncbi:MAG: hypothetical protein ACJA07_001487 [Rhodococcus sp. (in: high G+C Gram-positive bacteria)]|jgi:hypothetical protein